MRSPKRVVILQRWLMHYRLPFFQRLAELAREANVSVELLYGEPTGPDRRKKDWFRDSSIPGARRLEQWRLAFGEREVIWHKNVPEYLKGADLVVSQQENRILRNYLLALTPRRDFQLAWWGHGVDFQAGNDKLGDRATAALRGFLLRRADWFFAYTSLSARAVEAQGFPQDCITTLNNTIDVEALTQDLAKVTAADTLELRRRLDVAAAARIGVYVGGLYPAKRLDLLIEAGRMIRARIRDFVLVIAGSGVQEPQIREAVARHAWLKFAGPVFDKDKATLLATSTAWLNPGAVGLSVVDAFALGVPMVTTTQRHHGPEVAYLVHNENGILTEPNAVAFAAGVVSILEDESLHRRLAAAGKSVMRHLTIDRMAGNFLAGAESAIAQRPALAPMRLLKSQSAGARR